MNETEFYEREIPNDRIVRTIRWTVADLCAEWGVDPDLIIVEVGQAKRDTCQTVLIRRNEEGERVFIRPKTAEKIQELLGKGYQMGYRMRFGWQSLRYRYLKGHTEYASLQYLVRGRAKGLKGIEYSVRHEFAHALVGILNPEVYLRAKPHGPEFVENYTAILEGWAEWEH